MNLHRSLLFALALAGGADAPSCETPRVYGVEGVVVTAPTYEGRLDKALEAVGSEALTPESVERLRSDDGGALADRPDRFSGLPGDLEVGALLEDPEVRAALLANDEDAAATLLWAKGVRAIALHSEVGPSLDDDRRVLSRLYHHGQLSRFTLVRVGEGVYIYRLLEKAYAFPPQVAGICVAYLRHRLGGGAPARLPEIKSEDGRWTLMATLRSATGGRELVVAFAQDGKLQNALEELVSDLERTHRREVEGNGFPKLADGVGDLSIEIQRVVERAYVEPRGEETLEQLWELGLDGAFMMTADKKERGFAPGAVAYTQALTTADQVLRRAAEFGRMSERRPWRDDIAWLEILRTLHYMEIPGKGLVPLYRGVPPVPLEAVTLATVRESILLAGEWYLKNLQDDGSVTYKFWPSENRYSDEYNHVRHTLATWNLVQAWQLDPRPEFLEGAKKALGWTNKFLKEEGDKAFYSYNNNQKLGSVVVSLLGMIELAEATEDHQYDDLMRRMGNFSKSMQLENGSFNGYYVEPGHPYYGMENDIVPGEAALALVRLAEYFDDDSFIEGLPKYWEFYTPWFRTKAAKGSPESPWPQYTYENDTRLDLVEFGPWTVMAAEAYYRRTGDEEVAKFGLEIARWMIETYEFTSDRAPFPDYIGGYYKLSHELPAMQSFCYAEGTAAAYALALRFAPEEAPFFEEATRETARFLLNMQYNDLAIYPFSRGDEVRGGIRYAMNETKVRIDYVYHGQSSLVQWYRAALSDPNLPESVRVDARAEAAAAAAAAQAAAQAAAAANPAPAGAVPAPGARPSGLPTPGTPSLGGPPMPGARPMGSRRPPVDPDSKPESDDEGGD